MRISLKVGATIFPLAGAAGVTERTHSSAGDFTLTPESTIQIVALLRATYAKLIDRGNLLNTVSFTTTRQFATPADAEIWCIDYDVTTPRAGTLVFDAIQPSGAITRRHMLNAVVQPPRRRCIGATALVDFTVQGGQVIAASGGTPASVIINPNGEDNSILYTAAAAGAAGNSITIRYTSASGAATVVAVVGNAITVTPGKLRMILTGTLTSNGSTPYTLTPYIYTGILNERPRYSWNPADPFQLETIFWTGSNWSLGAGKWISTDDVATPDLVTNWVPQSPATGTPVVTAGISTAAEVIEAINASAAASALVNVAASGAVTGAVAAVSATNLNGGTD